MSTSSSPIAGLFAACDAFGVVLEPTSDGRLAVEGPSTVLVPGVYSILEAYKNDILLVLLAERDLAARETAADRKLAVSNGPTPDAVCRCGSTKWKDVPIHDGQSARRDCARCGRFLGWLQWYGRPMTIAIEKSTASRKEATDG